MDNKGNVQKIASFKIDHDKLVPGIYVSRIDGDCVTYDLRTRKPNSGAYMNDVTLHSVEHMFATYIRSSAIKDSVIYFGPMGCRTGFYLIVRGRTNEEVLAAVTETLEKILVHEGKVFGAHRKECGNYRCLSLSAAKKECEKYLAVLRKRGKKNDFKYEE